MDGYLTTEEIAQRLGVKVETVRRWVHQGKLPGLPLGRAGYRIRQEDFERFAQVQYPKYSSSLRSKSPALSPFSNREEETRGEAIATLMLERMTDGVLFFGPDGQCQYANASAAHLLGSVPEQLLGKTIAQILPENYESLQENAAKTNTDYFSSTTGRWFQLRAFAALHGRGLSFLDITECKQLEARLREREQQFTALVEQLPDVVFRLDLHLRHLYISPIIEHFTGYPPEAWLGKTGREMGLPTEACDRFESLCQQAIMTEQEQHMEFAYHNSWQRSRIIPERGLDGSISSLMGITEDITEQKQRELSNLLITDLTETFSSLSSQEAILRVAGERMAQYFHVSSLTCAQVDEANNTFTVVYDSNEPDPGSVFKMQRFSDYANDDFLCEMKAGRILVVNDTMSDPRTSASAEAFAQYPVRAFLLASHMSEGQVDFVIGMQHSEPYYWRKDEIDLLQELVVRIYPQLERARAERALRDSERQVQAERQRLFDLFMQAPAAIMVTKGPDHVYELLNPPAVQYLGVHRQYIGKPGREAVPEAAEQGFFDLLDAVYQTGKPFIGNEIPAQFVSQGDGTGSQMYFNFVYQPSYNAAGEIDGVLGYINNVTDAVLIRKRVEESEERLRALANSMPQLVWSARPDGAIDFFNERINEYAEIPRNETGIYEWQAIVHSDDLEATIHEWERATATGNAFEHEQRLRMKDGRYRWHLVRGVPSSDEMGVILRWYGTKTDIEQLKQLEQHKNDFIGVVSHELKTPVTSAKAFAEVLENRFRKAGDEKTANLLDKMNAQMDKLTFLIRDLLDVTKIEAGKLQFHEDFFVFDDLVDSIVEEVQRTTSHTIQREGSTGTTIYGDRERIGQVLTNLLTNAIKYSPNATKVVVTSSSTQQYVMLSVQDFGIGIARDTLPHVFERFFRETGMHKNTFPGLGLGLYVAAEIIQRQGGKIWAESEKGRGSTFYFSLPVQGSENTRRHDDLFSEGEGTHV